MEILSSIEYPSDGIKSLEVADSLAPPTDFPAKYPTRTSTIRITTTKINSKITAAKPVETANESISP